MCFFACPLWGVEPGLFGGLFSCLVGAKQKLLGHPLNQSRMRGFSGSAGPTRGTGVDGVFEITQVLDGVLSGVWIPDQREGKIVAFDKILSTSRRFSFDRV